MPRWIQALLATLLGLAAGLFYGWRVAPVEYVDLSPNALNTAYQAEYILMVAESYQNGQNLDLAVRQLALLNSSPPAEIITKNLAQNDYTIGETELLENLLVDIKTWQLSSPEAAQ